MKNVTIFLAVCLSITLVASCASAPPTASNVPGAAALSATNPPSASLPTATSPAPIITMAPSRPR